MSTAPAISPSNRQFSTAYRNWLLALMIAVNILNMADRQGLAAIAPAMKADLSLSDTQLGVVQGLGFAIFYTVMGLPIARLAETRSRIRIIASCVAIFATLAALCGLARNFVEMLACRIGVASGDAGFGPPVSSLLGDHFPASRRTSIITTIWLGAPVGAVAGSALGGYIAQVWGWRMWFYVLAVPAAVISLAIFLTLREPSRGMSDAQVENAEAPPSMREVLRFLWSKRSMRHILIGAAGGAVALNGIGQFLGQFFVSSLGLGFQESGLLMGAMSLGAMTSGFVVGGFGMDRAARWDRAWYVRGPAIALLLSVPILTVGFAQQSIVPAFALLLVGQIALFIFFTPTLALAQNMVGPRMRASSAFVVSLVVGLLGTGLGPTMTGILSDLYASMSFSGDFASHCKAIGVEVLTPACKAAEANGLRLAMMTLPLFALWASLHFWLAGSSLSTDLDTLYRARSHGARRQALG